MGKLVILRDNEEDGVIMFCGAQEQPLPTVCLEPQRRVEISSLRRIAGDIWSNLFVRTGP